MDETVGPDEDAFLRVETRTFLLGLRADGSPTGWPMVGLYPGSGSGGAAIEFSTYRRSQKVRDFERNPNVCCVVAPLGDDRALVLRGTAEVVTGRHELPMGRAARKPLNVDPSARKAAEARLRSGQRVVLRVEPHEARFIPGWGDAADAGEAP